MKTTIAVCLLALVMGGSPLGAFAQQSGPKEEAEKAGEAIKEAGKDTGDAAKHAGKATAKSAKKGAKTVKKAVTGDAHATCKDGTRQEGKTEDAAAAACKNHGGVAKH